MAVLGAAACASACGSSDDDAPVGAAHASNTPCSFIAVGYGGTVACSIDGSAWTVNKIAFANEPLSSVAADSKGNVVAVGQKGSIVRSADRGKSWTLAHSLDAILDGVASDGERFVIGHSPVLISTDGGETWKEGGRLDPEPDVDPAVMAITASGKGRFLAAGKVYRVSGGAMSARDRIYLSTDGGENWSVVFDGELQSPGSSLQQGFLGLAANGTERAVAVGRAGLVMYADGPQFSSWQDAAGVISDEELTAVTFDSKADRFVASELEGAMYVSSDSIAWTAGCDEPDSNALSDVTTGNGLVVAVGPATAIVSSNGADACAPGSSDNAVLFGVTFVP